MLGKRFSFKVEKNIIFTETFDLKRQSVTFFTKLSLRQQKSWSLLSKINTHYLFWVNFVVF